MDYKLFIEKTSRKGAKDAKAQRKNLSKLILLLFVIFSSCSQEVSSRTEILLGTVCTVTIYEKTDVNVYKKVFDRISEIENLMSVNKPASDVSRINAAAGSAPVKVHDDVFTVIQRALYFAEVSGGAFDPSIGPVVALWGIAGDNPRVPLQEEIEDALLLVNWRNVELDTEARTVFLNRTGMALDLGAIAKGFAADAVAEVLKDNGIKRAIIDLGGDIIILGKKWDRSPWRVGIQKPFAEQGENIGILDIQGHERGKKSIVTSGVSERFFVKDEIRYHHIFSPFNGYPADNNFLSVTISAENCMEADALSTAVFVLGYEEGIKLLKSFPGSQGIFVFEDKSVRSTPFIDLKITDNSFRMESRTE